KPLILLVPLNYTHEGNGPSSMEQGRAPEIKISKEYFQKTIGGAASRYLLENPHLKDSLDSAKEWIHHMRVGGIDVQAESNAPFPVIVRCGGDNMNLINQHVHPSQVNLENSLCVGYTSVGSGFPRIFNNQLSKEVLNSPDVAAKPMNCTLEMGKAFTNTGSRRDPVTGDENTTVGTLSKKSPIYSKLMQGASATFNTWKKEMMGAAKLVEDSNAIHEVPRPEIERICKELEDHVNHNTYKQDLWQDGLTFTLGRGSATSDKCLAWSDTSDLSHEAAQVYSNSKRFEFGGYATIHLYPIAGAKPVE
ncbi:MAG: hypothetical protein ACKV22_11010, partial [Bryobacteraceae bacterium]